MSNDTIYKGHSITVDMSFYRQAYDEELAIQCEDAQELEREIFNSRSVRSFCHQVMKRMLAMQKFNSLTNASTGNGALKGPILDT